MATMSTEKQLSIEVLRRRYSAASSEVWRIRQALQGLGALRTFAQSQFSEDDDMSPGDHVICRMLENTDPLLDHQAQQLAKALAKQARITALIRSAQGPCPSCGED